MPPVAEAPKRYFIEFNAVMVLYAATVIGRKYVVQNIDNSILRDLIVASPVLPVILTALVVYRFYCRMDEYHKRQLLEALAMSAGVTAVFVASWGFLEDIGAPKLGLMSAWIVIAVSWAGAALVIGFKDKAIDGAHKAIRRSLTTLAVVVGGTASFAGIGIAAGFATPFWELALIAIALLIVRIGSAVFSKSGTC
ncbi:hypothetical protein FHS83_000561 [Rhizomicrobium palustre]|uniref:Uncharacterized protein n=1 Tax=Rhizomicrobium palustre TaxID=189966 RepID=A0A846MV54_9PROT|nr:hypothetical protein [Rhizomicrobium palustre]NIK87243.1 hypothetical protein [Rhizomicrobium palustre]